MGNQMSVPQREENQENDWEADSSKVASDTEYALNGGPVIVSTCSVPHYQEVDLGIRVEQHNVATSSPETMEIRAVADASGKNLGKDAKPQAPAAKSRFLSTLSRPVPGRTGDQAADSSPGSATLDVSPRKAPAHKDPSESQALPAAAAPTGDADKTRGHALAEDEALSIPAPAPLLAGPGQAAPSKPKDSSFFEKLFKLDKGQEKAAVDSQQESRRAELQGEAPETSGLPGQPDDGPGGEDVVDRKEKGQEIGTSSCSVPGEPEELEVAKEGSQTTDTTESNHSIMSFFKTLVSPNKAETKKDPEDTGAETSPATSTDLKADKVNLTPQDTQGAAKNSKGCNTSGHVQSVTATETAKDGAKEKSGPTSLPLGKLFWKKSVKEDSVPAGAEENVVCESPVEIVKAKEVESALQTVELNEEGTAAPEPAEVKYKREDRKPSRTSLMAFLRQMSVKGDGGVTHSEEINGKDSSYQTSDATEKPITPPEPEPTGAAQKGKEGSSKDKKPAEMNKQKSNKQEAKEPAQCVEQAPGDGNSLQNGDKSQKRPEKRQQSLGGFFKGLGPKRMSDAQVQTDPVSIGPVGKSK